MRQRMRVATIAAATVALSCGSALAINLVCVESKKVTANSTDTIGVYITNDQPLVALTLPLEIRSLDPAAYMDSGTFRWEIVPGGRLDLSPLGANNPDGPPAIIVNRKFAAPPLDSGCVQGMWAPGYIPEGTQLPRRIRISFPPML